MSRSGSVNNGVNACYTYDRGDNRKNVTTATSSDCATFSFSRNSVFAAEGAPLTFTVNKVGGAQASLTVNYATSNGTAGGGDYTATSGTLTFATGDTSKTVTVPTTSDTTSESDETVILTLSSPSGVATLADTQATGIIRDDDVAFSVNNASGIEGQGATITFTVTKSATVTGNVSVNYSTDNGTAQVSTDYYWASGTLTFTPEEATKTVVVTLRDDAVHESTETFFLRLSQPSAGTIISDAEGLGTITDND